MTVAQDSSGITTQGYDARRMLCTVVAPGHPNGVPLTYSFDGRGLRTGMAFGAGRHTYAFDALRRNTGYVDPDGGRATWAYDLASQMTEQVNPNGTATTWAYESRGLTSGIRHRKSDGSTLGVDLYEWDANANPTRKVTLGGINTWGYDVIDQLTSEQHELGIVATWQYDPCANRSSQDQTQGGVRTLTNYAYDPANQVSTATEGSAVTTFTHDANGNMSGEVSVAGRVTYLWNPRDLQTGYCPPSGQIATFTHRYDDLRATIDPGDGSAATKLVWDPRGSSGYTDLLAETKQDQSVPRQYWRGAHLVTFKEPGEKCVYACDHLGSMECLLDAGQVVVAANQVSAWGEVLSATGVEQCFQYGGDWGAYCDALSRDLWMRARVMKAGLGRFLAADPLGGPRPNYRYADNQSTNRTDPLGLQSFQPPSWDDIQKAVWECAQKGSGMVECLGEKLTDATIDQNCALIVCRYLGLSDFCIPFPDPCVMKDVRVDACHDCCELTYYCCAMKARNALGVKACYNKSVKCHLCEGKIIRCIPGGRFTLPPVRPVQPGLLERIGDFLRDLL
jgi:RHS repeat-associated protein